MGKYGGITIGPIVDTLSLVSKPAGLWGASYMFSYLAKKLCEGLLLSGISARDILVPAIEVNEEGKLIMPDAMKEGVGLFHDRVIWEIKEDQTEKEIICQIQALIDRAKEELAQALWIEGKEEKKENWKEFYDFVKQYLQVHGICVDISEGNPLIRMSDYLDALELQKQAIYREKTHYILSYLDNEKIKNTNIFPKTTEFTLAKRYQNNGRESIQIKQLKDICQTGRDGYKTERYFAIVQADGDHMGAVLEQMKTKEQIQEFSKMCIHISETAYEIVKEYGGYMIYAGGDDLLFLIPLLSSDHKKSFLMLLYELSNNFNNTVMEKWKGFNLDPMPSLSFGVSIQYEKYPLYEALQQANDMLFQYAKNREKCKEKRDTVAISLQKHSGQALILEWNSFSDIYKELEEFFDTEIDAELMSSVYRLLHLYKNSLEFALESKKKEHIEALFDNIFDHEGQAGGESYINRVKNLALKIQDGKKGNMDWESFLKFLKLVQFYFEKGEE